MKFAKLTSPNGQPVWINQDGIIVRRATNEMAGQTVISSLTGSIMISVTEEPERVVLDIERPE